MELPFSFQTWETLFWSVVILSAGLAIYSTWRPNKLVTMARTGLIYAMMWIRGKQSTSKK